MATPSEPTIDDGHQHCTHSIESSFGEYVEVCCVCLEEIEEE